MRNYLLISCCVALPFTTNAELINRGNGFVYDSDLDITWLADANYAYTSGYDADGLMNYQECEIWINQLNFGGYTDWRLPTALPSATEPYCNAAYDCADTEYAHLYYIELDGVTTGPVGNVRNARLGNYGPFLNIQQQYWSGLVIDESYTMNFHFDAGYQIGHPTANSFAAWAVRNGDVPSDVDSDGLIDLVEDSNGNGVVDTGETDPLNSDSDGDGLLDGAEDINRNGAVDAGETDPLDTDSDNDGLSDGYEVNVIASDPTSPTTVYTNPGDMDGDGDTDVGDLILLQRQLLNN